jgi:hypothetical protein
MDPVLPAVPVLYNYDADRDDDPGLLIVKGGSGPDEFDNAKHQHWVTLPFPAGATIEGSAIVKLWSGMREFTPAVGGVVTVYLRDCDGGDCTELGSDTLAEANWQGGSNFWLLKTFTVPVGTYTMAPGHSLELVVVVDASSSDDMWFAYDINPYRSRVTVSASAAVSPWEGVLSAPVARWLAQTWARWFFT